MSDKTRSLINALRVLDSEIQSEDGVANAVVAEAATRLEEQQERIKRLEEVGDEVVINYVNSLSAFEMWRKAKESKL